MATYYSDLYAAIQSRTTSSGAEATTTSYAYKGPRGERAGQTVSIEGTFTCPAALATSDLGILFPLPKLAQLQRFAYYNTDFGTTCTTTIEVSTTDLLASIALGTAVTLANIVDLTAAQYSLGWAAVASAGADCRLAFTSVSTPTAGAVFTFIAQYQMPS